MLFGIAAAGHARADARADFEAAADAIKKGKRDEGIVLLTKVIDSKEVSGDELATMYYMRADLYGHLNKLDEALADYAKTIEIMPDHAAAFHDRATVYAQQKKFKEALDDLSRAQFLVPQSPLPHFNRGRVYEMMDRKADAIAEYRKARTLAPKMKEPQEALRRLGAR
ncbi:MAG: tetratricopeptide repeat protein [Alphaproteobacteria bacterium]